jgi:hypothetical protein
MTTTTTAPVVSSTDQPDWLKPADAARILDVSTRTLSRMADAGHLVARRIGNGKRRYLRSSVLDQAARKPTTQHAALVILVTAIRRYVNAEQHRTDCRCLLCQALARVGD